MSHVVDITGQRFGKLVVISRAPSKKGKAYWYCRCDCGKERIVQGTNLRRGLSTSCGCTGALKRKGSSNGMYVDLTGQTFGELTAIRYIRADFWEWQCSCGRIVKARPSHVKTGDTVSCGHVSREAAQGRYNNNVFQFRDGTRITALKAIVSGKLIKTNTSGATGVNVRKRANSIKYEARIEIKGKEIFLGTYDSFQKAVLARKQAEEKYFKPLIEEQESDAK